MQAVLFYAPVYSSSHTTDTQIIILSRVKNLSDVGPIHH